MFQNYTPLTRVEQVEASQVEGNKLKTVSIIVYFGMFVIIVIASEPLFISQKSIAWNDCTIIWLVWLHLKKIEHRLHFKMEASSQYSATRGYLLENNTLIAGLPHYETMATLCNMPTLVSLCSPPCPTPFPERASIHGPTGI